LATEFGVGPATSLETSTYLVDFPPVFFIRRCARDIDRIGRGFLNDLATAPSDAKAEEILIYAAKSEASRPFVETAPDKKPI
jgi:hypothetical protein